MPARTARGDKRIVVLLQRDHGEFKTSGRGAVVSTGVDIDALLPAGRSIVLVGLMGAGKSSIGRRLAQRIGLEFLDADQEIERAAGCTIEEIFARFGEPEFRAGERRVIGRLLEERGPIVLATGGGAFMDPETRARIRERGVSVWLRADLDVLYRRVARRNNRPLLKQGNPREILERLIGVRYPVYAEADVTVESDDSPPETTVEKVIEALRARRPNLPPAQPPLEAHP
ncbi:MAG: shikimate kinase [Alphaproteobacteria bacterium]|nr:shikimate kinase [Alphaproteobacteria bacterium]